MVTPGERHTGANFAKDPKAVQATEEKEEKKPAFAAVKARERLQRRRITMTGTGTTPTFMEKAAKEREKVKAKASGTSLRKESTMMLTKAISRAKEKARTTKVMPM